MHLATRTDANKKVSSIKTEGGNYFSTDEILALADYIPSESDRDNAASIFGIWDDNNYSILMELLNYEYA